MMTRSEQRAGCAWTGEVAGLLSVSRCPWVGCRWSRPRAPACCIGV